MILALWSCHILSVTETVIILQNCKLNSGGKMTNSLGCLKYFRKKKGWMKQAWQSLQNS